MCSVQIRRVSATIRHGCAKVHSPMKRALIALGVILMLLGIAAVLHPSYTYHQTQQVAKIGNFQATVDQEKTQQIPPLATVALLVGGIALVLIGSRAKS